MSNIENRIQKLEAERAKTGCRCHPRPKESVSYQDHTEDGESQWFTLAGEVLCERCGLVDERGHTVIRLVDDDTPGTAKVYRGLDPALV